MRFNLAQSGLLVVKTRTKNKQPDTSSHGPPIYRTVPYANAYEYSFMRTSTHLAGTICTCVQVRIHAYEYASSNPACVQVLIHVYKYASSRYHMHMREIMEGWQTFN